ncbi:hypothetical protein GY45DRAFT_1330669 [Cubamyces sp. BRFM 1775]|nr:hypothetical protein GY45DRAFT_1330669 [Cubamyces sp. BRFM 1775]
MAEYTPLVADHDEAVKAHFVDAEWAEPESPRRENGSSSIFSMKTGVAVLLLVNLALWAYAVFRLQGAAVFLGELVEGEYGPTRNLPLPDPLDGLGDFLALRDSQAAQASKDGY